MMKYFSDTSKICTFWFKSFCAYSTISAYLWFTDLNLLAQVVCDFSVWPVWPRLAWWVSTLDRDNPKVKLRFAELTGSLDGDFEFSCSGSFGVNLEVSGLLRPQSFRLQATTLRSAQVWITGCGQEVTHQILPEHVEDSWWMWGVRGRINGDEGEPPSSKRKRRILHTSRTREYKNPGWNRTRYFLYKNQLNLLLGHKVYIYFSLLLVNNWINTELLLMSLESVHTFEIYIVFYCSPFTFKLYYV